MFLHYTGDTTTENRILATRRKELKMTQQQVADKAGIQLRQYQRLEGGERNITGSTGRVLLAVCKALQLDPYTLVGNGNEPAEVKYIVLPPIETQGLTYAIPALAYYTLISAIPRGMVCSDDDLISCLRKAYGMDVLEIKRDMTGAQMHINECFPFWRVVSPRGYLVNQFYCSKERQLKYLEQEGIEIIKVGNVESYRVDEFESRKYDTANFRITVLQTEKQLLEQFSKLHWIKSE